MTAAQPAKTETKKESLNYSEYEEINEAGLDAIKNKASDVVTNTASKVTGAVTNTASKVTGAVDNTAKKINDKVTDTAGKITDTIGGKKKSNDKGDDKKDQENTVQEMTPQEWKQKYELILQIIKTQRPGLEKAMNDVVAKKSIKNKEGQQVQNVNLQDMVRDMLLDFDINYKKAIQPYIAKYDPPKLSSINTEIEKYTKELNNLLQTKNTDNKDKDSQEITVGDKTLKIGVPYRYKTTKNEFKSVRITKKSDDNKQLFGNFSGEDDEKTFLPASLVLDFKPIKDKIYKSPDKSGKCVSYKPVATKCSINSKTIEFD